MLHRGITEVWMCHSECHRGVTNAAKIVTELQRGARKKGSEKCHTESPIGVL